MCRTWCTFIGHLPIRSQKVNTAQLSKFAIAQSYTAACKTYQTAGETKHSAKILFQCEQDSIRSHGSGVVRTALIDGDHALESAVKSLPGVTRRRCFVHCTRIGLTRGGGKAAERDPYRIISSIMKLSPKLWQG